MAAVDKTQGGIGEPAAYAVAVTPSDADELATVSRALYIGGAGNLVVVTYGGDTVTLVGATAGSIIPIRVKQVKATSTTATSIVSLY